MSETPEQAAGPATVVTIFGRTYHLRGAEDPQYLERLAGVVDSKMREVWSSSGTADTLKIAILAALNLADESLEGRNRAAVDAVPRDHLERIANVIARLDGALGSAGPIPAQRD